MARQLLYFFLISDTVGSKRSPIVADSIRAEGEVVVKNNQKARLGRNAAWLSALLVSLSMGAFAATPAWAGKIHGKLLGTVDVPGGSLTLPLAPGSPDVTITLFLGGTGGPAVPIVVTPSTRVRGGTTLTLHDNDFIEAKALLLSGQIVAVKIGTQNEDEVEDE